MEERPIIFSALLIPGLLDGSKTQTRRTRGLEEINKNPDRWEYMRTNADGRALFWVVTDDPEPDIEKRVILVNCPYGQVGDRLWVRETYYPCLDEDQHLRGDCVYKTDEDAHIVSKGEWRSPMFMPRWASRILLEITEVRVERLQEISEADAIAEGVERDNYNESQGWRNYFSVGCLSVSAVESFYSLWNRINWKRGLNAGVNPWVWVLGLRRVSEE